MKNEALRGHEPHNKCPTCGDERLGEIGTSSHSTSIRAVVDNTHPSWGGWLLAANDSDDDRAPPDRSRTELLAPRYAPPVSARTLSLQAEGDIDDQLLTLKQVREALQVSKSWLYKEIAAGRFPAPHKLSHKVARWSRSDLRAWIARL